ncbi:MAG: carboxypeptidase M32 [Lachnospiraceae bacterium]|nr:carboxypeptidase M32 [Lachnospiraceae bacterium]
MDCLQELKLVKDTLREAQNYEHAVHVLNFDQETICPPAGVEEQGEVAAFLQNQAYRLLKTDAFIQAAEKLYAHREALSEFDRVLAERLHRDYKKTKNITPELAHEFSLIYNRAFVNWSRARKESDFALFAGSLSEVIATLKKDVSLREDAAGSVYDELLGDYERGLTSAQLDEYFGTCKERLIPLLQRIMKSKKKIRTDFLSRTVEDDAQRKMSQYLLEVLHYDFSRGAFTTTEHPFTDWLGRNDIRVTTHYYPDMFYASMYSIIHECGHALFEQLQPQENYDSFIQNEKTMAMHESVSRFYENRIGRSQSFINLIYDRARELFPQVLSDVSAHELYEAMNLVEPTLIRTEADEFTYTFHIIIRYELEKMMMNGSVSMEELPRLWNEKYQEYLGITPQNDREGILQDVHWTFGMGYFPTYALGNMYNAMYMKRLSQELDLDKEVAAGRFDVINGWMADNVFRYADRRSPKEWILGITGRELTPDDFLDYLEEKYSALYEL